MPSARLTVHVTARASRNEIAGTRAGALSVRVTAPPEDGKANKAVCELIASALGVPKSAVRVVMGGSSRTKVVEADGVTADGVERLLRAGGDRGGKRDE